MEARGFLNKCSLFQLFKPFLDRGDERLIEDAYDEGKVQPLIRCLNFLGELWDGFEEIGD